MHGLRGGWSLQKIVDRLLEIAPHPTPDVPPLLQQVPGKLLWQVVGGLRCLELSGDFCA